MTTVSMPAARTTGPSVVAVVGVIALLLAVLPIALNPAMPLVDLPNHIARHYIAANPGTALDTYYAYSLAAKGNSTGDILWLVLGRHLTDVYTFSRVLLALYAVNLVVSCAVLGRVLQGRWTLWPLASLLLVFNAPFFWGFQNFVLTLPLAIYALAAWLRLEEARPWVRALLFIPVTWALFQLHILGCVAFLTAAAGRDIQRLIAAGSGWPGHLRRNLVTILPYAVPVGLALMAILAESPNEYGNATRYGSLSARLAELLSPVDAVTNDGSRVLALSGAAIIVFLAVAVLSLRRRTGPRLTIAPRAIGPAIALTLLCLVVPSVLDGVALVQIRFPVVLCAVMIAGTAWEGLSPRTAAALLLLVAALATGRSIAVGQLAARHSADMGHLSAVLSAVPEGARLIPVRNDDTTSGRADWHLQAHAVPQAHAFVPTLFRGAHALQVREEWLPMTVAQGMSLPAEFILGDAPVASADVDGFWEDWQTRFTHLLALDPVPDALVATAPLTAVTTAGRFTLYRIAQ